MYHKQLIIRGKIVLQSPMHIGCDQYETDDRFGKKGEGQVQLVVKDKDGLPYIPASSLKGALRHICHEDFRADLFGTIKNSRENNETDAGKIGAIYFSNCFMERRDSYKSLVKNQPYPSYKDKENKEEIPIYISSRTRINRKTGAADQGEGEGGKLFNFEMVPAGASFTFEWSVLNATEERKRTISQFLTYLVHSDGFCLGNSKSSGHGRVTVPQDSLRIICVSASGQQTEERFEAIHQEQVNEHFTNQWLCPYELQLDGLGPYISINHDVQRSIKSEIAQTQPMIDQSGKPLLLPTSLKGILRKRAAWIARQTSEGVSDNYDKPNANNYVPEDIAELMPVQRLFGVTGWRGLLEIERIECIKAGNDLNHTSVAIDRFTGGSLRHALFKTRAFIKPSFRVKFRLRKAGIKDGPSFPNEADLKLFSALIEDITINGLQLGHGISKGFGWFDVTILSGEKGAGLDNYFIEKTIESPDYKNADKISDEDKNRIIAQIKRSPDKAPYNFVHIEDKVVAAPTDNDERHDKPVNQGVSGVLEMRYTAETPLLIGSDTKKNKYIQSVKMEDNYALPGSSLKGMIRSIYEIATFSGIGFMNEDRLTYRDMTPKSDYLTSIQDTAGDFHGGWLEKKDGIWRLTEVDWYRIKLSELKSRTECESDVWQNKSVKEKYVLLESKAINGISLFDGAHFQLIHPRIDKRICKKYGRRYNAVQELNFSNSNNQNSKWGKIICSDRIPELGSGKQSNKKTEVIFFEKNDAETETVNQEVMDSFFLAYGEPGSNGEKLGDYLEYWIEKKHRKKITDNTIPRIPVFYKGSVSNIQQMGMTRLMKVTYDHSLKDYLPCRQIPQQDFTQAVFGYVKKEDDTKDAKTEALASRVHFGWAVLNKEDRPKPNSGLQKTTVAMAPRSTFWPYYLKGKIGPATSKPEKMDYNSLPRDMTLAGRKRYPVHGLQKNLPPPPSTNNASLSQEVNSMLEFIPAAQDNTLRFEGQIRFHNLHPVELGALIWAITLGRNPHLRHSLGHSKAFGYGQLKADILSVQLASSKNTDLREATVDNYVDQFEHYMGGSDWQQSKSIQSLLNMANPEIGQELCDSDEKRDKLSYIGDHEVYSQIKKNSKGRGLPEFV